MANERQGEIGTEVRDGLGWITLTRPEKKNALTTAMWTAIPGAVRSLVTRERVVAIVLQGAGENFGAGADLDDVARATVGLAEATAYCTCVVNALLAVATCPVPTLALVRGFAAGGGAELAIAADMRVADATASFSFPFARLGVVPDRFTLARLASLVGLSVARRLVLTGETVDAPRALALGLVDDVAAVNDLSGKSAAWGEAMRSGSARASAIMKRELLEGEATEDAADLIDLLVESFVSGDVRAAALRFLHDRPS